ncbi:UNVERIFIED_CONTAM: hypothetical protein K2H54_024857 [Gekko kuhli]
MPVLSEDSGLHETLALLTSQLRPDSNHKEEMVFLKDIFSERSLSYLMKIHEKLCHYERQSPVPVLHSASALAEDKCESCKLKALGRDWQNPDPKLAWRKQSCVDAAAPTGPVPVPEIQARDAIERECASVFGLQSLMVHQHHSRVPKSRNCILVHTAALPQLAGSLWAPSKLTLIRGLQLLLRLWSVTVIEELQTAPMNNDEKELLQLLSTPHLRMGIIGVGLNLGACRVITVHVLSQRIVLLYKMWQILLGKGTMACIRGWPDSYAMLVVHDTVAQKNFDPVLPPLPDNFDDDFDEESVKIVRLVKNKEPLGATIRRDEHTGAVIVARIMRGGAADRSELKPNEKDERKQRKVNGNNRSLKHRYDV